MEADVNARLERMEAALARMTAVLDQIQPHFAMVADIADEWVQTRVGGDRVEARLAALEDAVLRVSDPEVVGALTRMAERAPRLEKVADLATTFDDSVAMATDIADEWVAENVGGAGVDARLQGGLDALLRLTEPEVLGALTRLAERAPKLEKLADLATTFDDSVAMAADIADEWVADNVGGAAVDARLQGGLDALVRLSEPEVLGALTRLAERAPKLEKLADLAASFDDNVAMAADIADEWAATELGGASIEERLQGLKRLALHTTQPDTLVALQRLFELFPKMEQTLEAAAVLSNPEVEKAMLELSVLAPRLMKTARVAADLDDFVSGVAAAMHEPAEPLGPFAVFSALREPDVKQGVGRAIHITRYLGRSEKLLPLKS
ncbi:MAG: DUF1641 domain-containing protein [Alphaproteobacteria bacterium]|nr:DUF1641 domain-containing protein [Alphaproteobacteria bacterium]MCB9693594.1 DUF1641 domain-containing protein [Alphaproteobacteria bacterium]